MKKALALLLTFLLLALTVLPCHAAEPSIDTAQTALLYCFHTGRVLYQKNADKPIATGNTAQLMTALLTLEAFPDLTTAVTLTEDLLPGWYAPDDYRTLADYGFKKNATVSIRDLLAATVIENANCASLLLASIVAGSRAAFTEKMNERAAELGMKNTVFKNPAGYDAEGAKTTANDLLILAKLLYETPAFMTLASAPSYPMTSSGSRIYTRNYMLGKWYTSEYLYANANGMKAGYTDEAGNTLVATATEANGYSYLAIVLGGEDRNFKNTSYAIATELFRYGSTNFALREILSSAKLVTALPITNGDGRTEVNLFPKETVFYDLNKAISPDELTVSYTLNVTSLDAPFEQGMVVGEVTVSYEGEIIGKTELVTANGVRRAQNANLKARLIELLKPTLTVAVAIGAFKLYQYRKRKKTAEE